MTKKLSVNDEATAGAIWMSDILLSRRYSVSRQTVWHWARTGRIPKPEKIGPNTSRWNVVSVDKALGLNP